MQSHSPASLRISMPLCVTEAPFTLTRAALTSARGELTFTRLFSFFSMVLPFLGVQRKTQNQAFLLNFGPFRCFLVSEFNFRQNYCLGFSSNRLLTNITARTVAISSRDLIIIRLINGSPPFMLKTPAGRREQGENSDYVL